MGDQSSREVLGSRHDQHMTHKLLAVPLFILGAGSAAYAAPLAQDGPSPPPHGSEKRQGLMAAELSETVGYTGWAAVLVRCHLFGQKVPLAVSLRGDLCGLVIPNATHRLVFAICMHPVAVPRGAL